MNHWPFRRKNTSQLRQRKLFRKDEEITEKVFEEMRVKPIWYTKHTEIPDFVKAIRE